MVISLKKYLKYKITQIFLIFIYVIWKCWNFRVIEDGVLAQINRFTQPNPLLS